MVIWSFCLFFCQFSLSINNKFIDPNIFGCRKFLKFVDFYNKMYRIKFWIDFGFGFGFKPGTQTQNILFLGWNVCLNRANVVCASWERTFFEIDCLRTTGSPVFLRGPSWVSRVFEGFGWSYLALGLFGCSRMAFSGIREFWFILGGLKASQKFLGILSVFLDIFRC